jgi:hypothetical protein
VCVCANVHEGVSSGASMCACGCAIGVCVFNRVCVRVCVLVYARERWRVQELGIGDPEFAARQVVVFKVRRRSVCALSRVPL